MKHSALIFCLMVSSLCAQQVKVSFLAQDEQTGHTVPDYLIIAGDRTATADSNGKYILALAAGEAVELVMRHPAYRPLQLRMVAASDSPVVVFMKRKLVNLDEVTVNAGKDNNFGIGRMNDVDGTTVYAGKKSEVVHLQDLNANLATNNSRQIFSKVAGINIFENDGAGVSIGIGGRGLNPNRISNFNTRQNGYDISADALGYPESYYVPPAEALESIEILRGAAGLQFGTQFGGMINYRFAAPSKRALAGDFRQTGGSFGFFNSFNRVSGTVGRVSYNTFYQYKTYNGWRERSALQSNTAFASVKYSVTTRLSLTGEFTHMEYLAQQPGGLTDTRFEADPGYVNRRRNWFRVNWNLLALTADYRISDKTVLTANAFGLNAGREALGNLGRPDRADDTSALRNLLRDRYMNHGGEARLVHRYLMTGRNQHFLIGARYYDGHTARAQGSASKSDRADFSFINPSNPDNSGYDFPSKNYALFMENVFRVAPKMSITPGVRAEFISTESEGYYRLTNRSLAGDTLLDITVTDNRSLPRSFVIGGVSAQYKARPGLEMYANFSQNYRSINFNDMRVVNPSFQVDPNLADERGYTADGGVRGSLRDLLYYDAGLFLLRYGNRIGTTLVVDSATFQIVRYRTNIGASRCIGAEAFAELDWIKLLKPASRHRFSTFVNVSFMNAVYTTTLSAYSGNKVEYAPNLILRTGATWAYRGFSVTYQYSHTSAQFSEATNALSSASGIYGVIPAYSVMDLSTGYNWKRFGLHAGVINLSNAVYFTRRAEGYPGPGILPADPRNIYLTLRVRL